MTIDDIYEVAKERGLVRSKRHFSQELLGMASNYAAHTGLDRCSTTALLNLYRRLGELGQVDLQARTFEWLLEAETRDGETHEAVQP
jgi:hypothetical protein